MSWEKGGPSPVGPRCLLRAVLLAAGALVVGACSASHPPRAAPATSTIAATTPTTTSTIAPTTVYQPTAPQSSRDAAAAHLIAAWRAGDRAAAAADALPAAVAALFAQAYPPGDVQFRGCSVAAAGPSSCDYRILGTGGLLEVSVVEGTGGWLSQAAQFLS
jgi:hypothetical protein